MYECYKYCDTYRLSRMTRLSFCPIQTRLALQHIIASQGDMIL